MVLVFSYSKAYKLEVKIVCLLNESVFKQAGHSLAFYSKSSYWFWNIRPSKTNMVSRSPRMYFLFHPNNVKYSALLPSVKPCSGNTDILDTHLLGHIQKQPVSLSFLLKFLVCPGGISYFE